MPVDPLFDLSALTPEWRAAVEVAFGRGRYPWATLREGLHRKVGRTAIPIDAADLSRYGAAAASLDDRPEPIALVRAGADGHEDHDHHHPEEGGDKAHLIAHRKRALGLAWYSGRVTLELTLLGEPELLAEVLWAELAHMVDFFGMTGDQRRAIYAAFHGGEVTDHGHGDPEDWFGDKVNLGYWFQVGEAFMGGFILAFTDIRGRLGGFGHTATPEVGRQISAILVGPALPPPAPPPPAPPSPPVPPPPPPPDSGPAPYFAREGSTVFHDTHRRVPRDVEFATVEDARAAGLRPCGICKPRPSP